MVNVFVILCDMLLILVILDVIDLNVLFGVIIIG